MSRRGFLGTMAAAALAGCADKLPNAAPPERTPTRTPIRRPEQPRPPVDTVEFSELHPEHWIADPEWVQFNPEARECVERFRGRLAVLEQELAEQFDIRPTQDKPGAMSLTQQDAARELLLSQNLLHELKGAAESIVKLGDREALDHALRVFAFCGMQGQVYSTIKQKAATTGQVINFDRDPRYYATTLRDYVPSPIDTWSEDIDPRNKVGLNAEERNLLTHRPGWAGREHKRAFRALVADREFLTMAQAADLNLAEYYSLAKMVIKHRQPGQKPTIANDLLEARKCLERRAAFAERILLNEDTEQMLVFYGRDRAGGFHGEEESGWSQIGLAAGVTPEKIRHFGQLPTQNIRDTLNNFQRAIADSRGKTFIALEAHGRTNGMGLEVDHRLPYLSLPPSDLAGSLLDRVRRSDNPRTLGELTLSLDSNFSYDFIQNLLAELKRQWHPTPTCAVRFEQLAMPTIIVTAQEPRPGDFGVTIAESLQQQVLGIRRDGCITGKRISQNTQPACYPRHDLNVFASNQGTATQFATNLFRRTIDNAV